MAKREEYPKVYLITYLEALEAGVQIIEQEIAELEEDEIQSRKQLGVLEAMAEVLGHGKLSKERQSMLKELPSVIRDLEEKKDKLVSQCRLMTDAIAREKS